MKNQYAFKNIVPVTIYITPEKDGLMISASHSSINTFLALYNLI